MMKLSEYPANTLIRDLKEDVRHLKGPDGIWEPLDFHCVDCAIDDVIKNEDVDEKVVSYKILALPFGVAAHLGMELQEEYGDYDSEGEPILIRDLIDAAIEHEAGRLAALRAKSNDA